MKIPNLTQAGQVLGSKWDGLSPHLLASFYVVENKDGTWRRSESVYGLLPFCQRECWMTRGSIAHVYPASWLGVVARAMMSYPRVCS